jgi:hypothetical protein
MARRMVLGTLADGTQDLRLSRPGVDAYTADPANRLACSFSAAQVGMGELAAAGQIYALNILVSLGTVFPIVPPVMIATLRGGGTIMDDFVRQNSGSGAFQDGNPYVAVVTTSAILVTTPAEFAYGLPPGDLVSFMAVRPI